MSSMQENKQVEGQVNGFGMRKITKMLSKKQSLYDDNDNNDNVIHSSSSISPHNSNYIYISQPQSQHTQTNALQSYLSIRQVQSKQIAIADNNSLQNNDCHKRILLSPPSKDCVHNNHPIDGEKCLEGFVYQMVCELVVFKKIYDCGVQEGVGCEGEERQKEEEKKRSKVVILTIRDVVEFVHKSQQKQQHCRHQRTYTHPHHHHAQSHQQQQQSVSTNHHIRRSQHLPLSHNNISNNIFSIDEYNPVDVEDNHSQRNSHHGQSISLFSRMMKVNLPCVQQIQHHNNDNNMKASLQHNATRLHNTIMSSPLQTTLFTIQQFIITTQQSLKSTLSQIVQNKITTRSFPNNQQKSTSPISFNNIQYSRKQISLLLTDYQVQRVKECIVIYAIVVREIVMKLKGIQQSYSGQLFQTSYNSKQKHIQSFPTFPSKSLTSLTTRQFASKSLQQSTQVNPNKITSLVIHHHNIKDQSIQLLIKRIKQNKLNYNRKSQQHISTQNYNYLNTKSPIPQQLSQFRTLLYDVWLSIEQKKINTMQQFDDGGDQSQQVFTDIYQLLPNSQQVISFLIFVLKQLQYNFMTTAKQQLSFGASDIYSPKMKQSHHHKIKSLEKIEGQIVNSQVSTKRISPPHKKSHQHLQTSHQQLSQTRNIINAEIQQQFNINNPLITNYDNDHCPKSIQSKLKSINSNVVKNHHKNNNNSSSKLALSKLYQSKLNNIVKNTQRINTQKENVKSSIALVNTKIQTSRHDYPNPTHPHQSTTTLHIKQQFLRSKNPTDHQSHINILNLKKALNEKTNQLQQKQILIKKLMFIHEINAIDTMNEKKHLEQIYNNKVQTIRNNYKEKLKIKGDQVKETKQHLQDQKRYTAQLSQQRRVQAKLFTQSNQLYSLKKCLLTEKVKQQQLRTKNYSQSLANLKKGCYKQIYSSKNKQNIHELSNITAREENSMFLRNIKHKQQGNESKLLLKTPCDSLQMLSQKDIILNKINKIQQKIISKNQSIKPKFFSRS